MKKKVFAFVFAVLFAFTAISPVYAASQEELEAQKQEASEKKAEAQFQIDMTQTTIEGISSEIERAEAEIEKINAEIANLDAQISNLETDIQTKNARLAELEMELAQQSQSLEERLRVMYMFGNDTYLEVLFSSKDFAELISRMSLVRTIAQADRDAVNTLEATSRAVSDQKAAIESTKAEVESLRGTQSSQLSAQQEIKNQEQALLNQNQNVLEAYQQEYAAQQAIYDQADQALAQIASDKEAEYAPQTPPSDSSSSGGNTDTGNGGNTTPSQGLIWPISSNYYPKAWDDMYGDRIHPVFGTWTWHSGCDMAAPAGTPVWSPGDGVVTFAGWNGGYGNCVMVAVEGGTVLFGHLSAIYVSEGQRVSQGETVGAVGTTGTSTGNHLHLSFLVNGSYVDPLNYMHW